MRIAAAWFVREDWDEIKRICADDLQVTYDAWSAEAEQQARTLSAQGYIVEKVIVRTHDIRQRQRATGRKVDAQGRSEIAVKLLIEAHNGGARH
jgi:hypothetical protein